MATKPTAIRQKLDRGMTVPLTLILTIDGSPEPLRRWLGERPAPWARCALTVADNVPTQFIAHLTTALRPLMPKRHPMPGSQAAVLDATTALLNALLDVPEDFALVLEDYQTITSPAIHAAVTLMADYPPPQMHLYLISQTVPRLSLARLRVRRQLVEIDLRPT